MPKPCPIRAMREEVLLDCGLTPGALAHAVGEDRTRIERLLREEQPLTSDTTFRLAAVF